ncbi:TetR/AcrR family transcriptional regulator [Granulicella sp. dw_53]|uniref:TetR/AcrR family transcriptional regulator n=1 Tax=Granulicella sp. dw_53 TaxID=2719792 RepID=UPI001BD438DC|nr:TetR/AcrR family transcriptional regulator [Granulicella sp. dw_53]
MRYPASETAEKHTRILQEASRLFRERGFSGVSLSEIMKATGLTHGPFYNHFSSKEALMAESTEYAMRVSLEGLEKVGNSPEIDAVHLDRYLSTYHRDNPGKGCSMAALAAEICREPAVQGPFTTQVKAVIEKMATYLPWRSKRTARADSIRRLSAVVGAVILSRAVNDDALSDEILREVRKGFV